jgi:FkbM family methyltransferase
MNFVTRLKNLFIKIYDDLKFYFYYKRLNEVLYETNKCKYILTPIYEIDKQVLHNKFEKMLTSVLKSCVKPNFICFDVGANFGFYTILFNHLASKNGRVYAFEPSNYQFERLLKNIRLNKSENIIANAKAIGNENKKINFFEYPPLSGLEGHSTCEERSLIHLNLFHKNSDKYLKKQVDQMSLDSFVEDQNIKRVHFNKIYVEGFDLQVIKGTLNLIKKFKPKIIFELNINRNKDVEYDIDHFKLILKNYNFYSITSGSMTDKLFKIKNNEIPKNITDILAIYNDEYNDDIYSITI